MPMPTGPTETAYEWSSYEDEVKDWLSIEQAETSYDTILKRLVKAAGRKADEYMMNPFEDLVPTITLASVAVGDSVLVNGQEFEAAAAEDADEREFDQSGTDAQAATSLAGLINSDILGGTEGPVGVEGVSAAANSAVVTLSKKFSNVTDIEVTSSDDDTLKVTITRTVATLPDDIILWCLAFVAWRFGNRDGRLSERREAGITGIEWGVRPSMDLLDPYAFQYEG
jgi:hypothetical protein